MTGWNQIVSSQTAVGMQLMDHDYREYYRDRPRGEFLTRGAALASQQAVTAGSAVDYTAGSSSRGSLASHLDAAGIAAAAAAAAANSVYSVTHQQRAGLGGGGGSGPSTTAGLAVDPHEQLEREPRRYLFYPGRISNLIRENELLFIVTSPDLESHKCKRVTDFLNNNFILERRRICCISNINGIMALVKKSCSYLLLCALSSKSGKLANQLLLPAAKKAYKKCALENRKAKMYLCYPSHGLR